MKHSRCKSLFQEDFTILQQSKIIILGIGGVGGFALDCLYRSGVEDITIVDFDTFELSNQNRQIGSQAVGKIKVEHLQTLYPNITAINKKIDNKWIEEFNFEPYDLILDAIDDINPKIQLIIKYHKKLISTTGSAKRIDPMKIEYISIFKTYNDPFAKKIREELKKERFNKNFKVIFSSENPQCKEMGSFAAVTGAFGLTMCSIAVKKLLNKRI